jgi:hypothetical protein
MRVIIQLKIKGHQVLGVPTARSFQELVNKNIKKIRSPPSVVVRNISYRSVKKHDLWFTISSEEHT